MSPSLTLFQFTLFTILVSLAGTNAHIGPFAKGMYCQNGTTEGVDNQNNNAVVQPLFDLTKDEWWFHSENGCNKVPPPDGEFLEIPAGGSFQVELADNQAHTTLSYGGKFVSEYINGGTYDSSNPYNYKNLNGGCITNPNMHTQNQSNAAGTAFAISYVSDMSQVTQDNLVVFTVAYNTPWLRVATYEVPAKMPPCPPEGCMCAWGWVPNGCGEPNMYMAGFKCKVTNSISNVALAKPNPPVWCEGNPSNCTKGAKQFIGWNQHDGNNIEVDGFDLEGAHKSPAYNMKLGFANGAQNDIFEDSGNTPVDPPVSSPSSSPASTPASTPASSPVSTPVSTPVNTPASTPVNNLTPVNNTTPVTTPVNDPPANNSTNDSPPTTNPPPPVNPPPPANPPPPSNNKGLCRNRNPTSKKRSAVYDDLDHSNFIKKSITDFSSHRRNSRFSKLRRVEKRW